MNNETIFIFYAKFTCYNFSLAAGGKQTSTYSGNTNYLKDEEYEEEYGPVGNEDEYYDENDNQNVQNQHHQQHLQHQQRPGQQQIYHQQQHQQQQYKPQTNANQGFQHYPRSRRDLPDFNDLELKNRLSCNRSRCALIRCTTSQLDTDSSAWIALRMRLVTQTLNLVCNHKIYEFIHSNRAMLHEYVNI